MVSILEVWILAIWLRRREVINQTSFVDVSVEGITTTSISSTTFIPLLESSTTTLTPTHETVSEAEESPVPTNPPSMFSTSMAPPRPTQAGQEEELITVAPTIKEEHEDTDDVTATPDFNIEDFATNVEFAHHRGDRFPEPQNTTESIDTTESASKPFDETDDHSVIEISTIQPDVPIPDASLITEPMFAQGKTEETILDSGITTAMASDLTDTTESTELTSEEVFSSESTPSTTGLHSTTPFPDYYPSDDEIETGFAIEGTPPFQPPQQDLSVSTSTTAIITTTAPPPETTSTATQTTPQMQDVETPAVVNKQETTSAAATATAVLIDSGTSAEDVTSSTSVFDESTTELPEHSGDTLTEDSDTATEFGTEYFTSAPMASAVADTTTTPGTVVADEQSIQVTTVMPMQNVSVDQALQPQDSQSPPIPVVPDHPTPSIADGEPILQSGDPDLFSQAAVTITPTVSFINGKHEITLEPQSPEEKEAKVEDTATSADFVPTVTPAEPQITKATKETQTMKDDKETTTVITTSVQEEASSQEGEITPDTESPITSEVTEPPVSSTGKDDFTVTEHITQSPYTTMPPHTTGATVSGHTTVDFTTVSPSSVHKQDGFTSMSTPAPSIMYQSITDQQVVIITPSSIQAKTDLTEQTPTMVLHVSKPSTSTTIIFTEDAKDEDELFSAVTDSTREGSPTPELFTKDDTIIDADTISVVPSSSLYPTIQTEEVGGVTAVTMTQMLEVTEEPEGSGTDNASFFNPTSVTLHAISATDSSVVSTFSEYLLSTSKPSTTESTDSESEEMQDAVLTSTHQPTGVTHATEISTSSETEVAVTTMLAERISFEPTSNVLSASAPSQPDVMVKYVTTVSPVQHLTTPPKSFEQASG
ncbi:uncharacterized protein [Enoplosus armatus]|uniref:uncharacterized protein n=1 Tax=Enoplosus armatus TaxID=215367 RepID=UPI0039953EFB